MKAAIITPIPLLPRYGASSNFHMVLTHLVERDTNYTAFYMRRKDEGDYILLDNSLIELGGAVALERVVAAATRIGAHEIVLPDVFKDGEGTISAVRESLSILRQMYGDNIPFKLMAVAQGCDEESWFRCYNALLNYPEISVIGIPKVTNTFYTGTRWGRHLLCGKILPDPSKEYHLLGIWDNPIEVALTAIKYRWVRSVDSSLPIQAARHGIAFLPSGMEASRPQVPFNFETDFDPMPLLTEHNIATLLRWCKGE